MHHVLTGNSGGLAQIELSSTPQYKFFAVNANLIIIYQSDEGPVG
jgi:hypothetical protein